MTDVPDFAALVVDHFLARRQRGLAISAIDQQLILRWERSTIPLHIVVAGIDEAFDRLVEPPRSLMRCARFVSQRWQQAKAQQAGDRELSVPPRSKPAPLDVRLRDAAEAAQHRAFAGAFTELADEVSEILADQPSLPAHLYVLLDQALVDAILERLEPAERREIEASARAIYEAIPNLAAMSERARGQRHVAALKEVLAQLEPWPM